MTFEEVKTAVREMNIYPHQLFDMEEIKNDRTFSKIFTENETLKVDNEKLKKENTEVLGKSKEAIRQLDVSGAKTKLDTFMKDLTEKQKTFITKQFKPEMIEKLDDEGIKEFVENSKKEFAETAKLFGSGVEENLLKGKGSGGEESSSPGTMEEQALKELGVD